MSDYADNIRRLAKQGKLKGALGRALDRDPIPGALTPFSSGAFGSQTYSSNGGDSGDGTGGTPTTNDETTEDNSNETDPNNPNTFNKGGSSSSQTSGSTGTQDTESVIDGEAGPQPKDETQNESESTDIPSTGSLTGLTGATDCTTGDSINFHLDGVFPAPDGWDDPDTPPEIEGFALGTNWVGPVYSGTFAASSQAAAHHVEQINIFNPGGETGASLTGGLQVISGVEHVYTYSSSVATNQPISMTGAGCTPSGSDPECPLSAPTETEWPTDNSYDLALVNGSFVTNQYDSEAPADAGGSAVDFCFGTGRTGRVYATSTGGFMLIETEGGAPKAGTVVRVYASDGTLQAFIQPTPSIMAEHLPK